MTGERYPAQDAGIRRIDERQSTSAEPDDHMPVAAVDPDVVGIAAKVELRYFTAIGSGIEMDQTISLDHDDLIEAIKICHTLRFVQPADPATAGKIPLAFCLLLSLPSPS